MIKLLKLIAIATTAFFVAGTAPASAQKSPVYTGILGNVAAGGYDTVSFFDGGGVEGSKTYTTTYKGAEWRFVSQANLDRFKADPAAFAPQYGGYCSWAVAQGYTAKGDPRFAKIVKGKLYLNFNQDVQDKWLADVPGFIAKADANWPAILSK